MSELRINNPEGLQGMTEPLRNTSSRAEKDGAFDLFLNEAIDRLKGIQSEAQKAVRELAQGGDVTGALIAMQKAELSFQLMIELRNRLISAYEEIQRMQV